MNKLAKRFSVANLSLAIMAGLSAQSHSVLAQQQDEENVIEEVVATGTRLKGTAAAVLQERKEQAFVADILGADQISRTGDSDAASALRRVTGLTLVDGKFIYVRGLGERYSSTQLNGMTVPSPDPTRSVIPLDLFPAEIIESLSVQKAYSPSMPASFGGGNVDIRLKTIPNDFVFKVSGGVGINSENMDDGWHYADGSDDYFGRDDGTRAMPDVLRDVFDRKLTIEQLSIAEQQDIALALNRNYDPVRESVDPDMSFDVSVGDYYDINDDWRIGFLATVGYDNAWQVSEEFQGNQFSSDGQGGWTLQSGWPIGESNEHSVQWSGLLNLGLKFTNYHNIDVSLLTLNDTRDQIRERYGFNANTSTDEGQYIRSYDVLYEERHMRTGQIKGSHTLDKLWFLGIDWKYSESRSFRRAPGNITTGFSFRDLNDDQTFDRALETISLIRGRTGQTDYTFQRLDDIVKNWGGNLSLPISLQDWELEFKAGVDFVQKARVGENRAIGFLTNSFSADELAGFNLNDILTDQLISEFESSLNQNLLRQSSAPGDDYTSAQITDAAFFEFDAFFNNQWRISGGVRWEEFKQAILDSSSRNSSNPPDRDFDDLTFQEDDFYPAIAITYIPSDDMQYRFSFAETVVRPDLREISDALYIDPLTEFPIRGTPGLRPTSIKHYDFRWEWYLEQGDNLSVALFYKDMIDPIEGFQTEQGDSAPRTRIANGESAEVYGIEVEFLKGLGFLGADFNSAWNDLFVSGNVTLSDSDTQFDRAKITEQTGVNPDITNLSRRLTGHSEYVVNMQLGYDAPNGEHSATLVYNVFGERIIIPGIGLQDDAFEQPFHSLDFVYTYYPDFNSTVKFKLNNILDQKKEIEFEGIQIRSETKGIGASVSYTYEF